MAKAFTQGKAAFKPQDIGPDPAMPPPLHSSTTLVTPTKVLHEPTGLIPFSSRIQPQLHKALARLSVELGRSRIELLQEAVTDLLSKYNK
jgi:hypothetical protein